MPDWECIAVRRRLSEDRDLTLVQSSHVAQCRACGRAGQRLSHAAAPVDMPGFVPGAHVAHALAAAITGFAATAQAGDTYRDAKDVVAKMGFPHQNVGRVHRQFPIQARLRTCSSRPLQGIRTYFATTS